MLETRQTSWFPVWKCSQGHVNDTLRSTCGQVVEFQRCGKRTPCRHSDGFCSACGKKEEYCAGYCDVPEFCQAYAQKRVCGETRPCNKCGSLKGARAYTSGHYCNDCLPKDQAWPYAYDEKPTLAQNPEPQEWAKAVPASQFKGPASLAVILEELGFSYDVRKSVGPFPDRKEVVCVRIRRPDGGRAAALWSNGLFWFSVVRDYSGQGNLTLTDLKAWFGLTPKIRKPSAPRAKSESKPQTLRNTMR